MLTSKKVNNLSHVLGSKNELLFTSLSLIDFYNLCWTACCVTVTPNITAD